MLSSPGPLSSASSRTHSTDSGSPLHRPSRKRIHPSEYLGLLEPEQNKDVTFRKGKLESAAVRSATDILTVVEQGLEDESVQERANMAAYVLVDFLQAAAPLPHPAEPISEASVVLGRVVSFDLLSSLLSVRYAIRELAADQHGLVSSDWVTFADKPILSLVRALPALLGGADDLESGGTDLPEDELLRVVMALPHTFRGLVDTLRPAFTQPTIPPRSVQRQRKIQEVAIQLLYAAFVLAPTLLDCDDSGETAWEASGFRKEELEAVLTSFISRFRPEQPGSAADILIAQLVTLYAASVDLSSPSYRPHTRSKLLSLVLSLCGDGDGALAAPLLILLRAHERFLPWLWKGVENHTAVVALTQNALIHLYSPQSSAFSSFSGILLEHDTPAARALLGVLRSLLPPQSEPVPIFSLRLPTVNRDVFDRVAAATVALGAQNVHSIDSLALDWIRAFVLLHETDHDAREAICSALSVTSSDAVLSCGTAEFLHYLECVTDRLAALLEMGTDGMTDNVLRSLRDCLHFASLLSRSSEQMASKAAHAVTDVLIQQLSAHQDLLVPAILDAALLFLSLAGGQDVAPLSSQQSESLVLLAIRNSRAQISAVCALSVFLIQRVETLRDFGLALQFWDWLRDAALVLACRREHPGELVGRLLTLIAEAGTALFDRMSKDSIRLLLNSPWTLHLAQVMVDLERDCADSDSAVLCGARAILAAIRTSIERKNGMPIEPARRSTCKSLQALFLRSTNSEAAVLLVLPSL